MKQCAICKSTIYNWTVIDGIKKNTSNRKFCFTCSPIGKHNTRDLTRRPTINGKKYRICSKCDKTLEDTKDNFYESSQKSYCKTCLDDYTHQRQKAIKIKMVNYKGGSCCLCGYNAYLGALEFHHIDPKKKDFNLSKFKNRAFETVKEEVDKCILVCSNCHREIHGGLKLEQLRNLAGRYV